MAQRKESRSRPPRPVKFKRILANCSCGWTWRTHTVKQAQQALAAHVGSQCGPLIMVMTDGSMDEAFQGLMQDMGLTEDHA